MTAGLEQCDAIAQHRIEIVEMLDNFEHGHDIEAAALGQQVRDRTIRNPLVEPELPPTPVERGTVEIDAVGVESPVAELADEKPVEAPDVERLASVQATYDPDGVFRTHQAIRELAASSRAAT